MNKKHRQDRNKMREVSLPMIHNSKMLEEELYFRIINGSQEVVKPKKNRDSSGVDEELDNSEYGKMIREKLKNMSSIMNKYIKH